MSFRPIFPPSLGLLQLADRNSSLTVGGELVKRVAFIEPRVKHGVFLYKKRADESALLIFIPRGRSDLSDWQVTRDDEKNKT